MGSPEGPGVSPCALVEARLEDLALGQVPEPERGALLAHAAGCGRCGPALAETAALVDELLALAPRVEPPAGFEGRALAAMGSEPSGVGHDRRRRAGSMLVAAAAVIVVAVVGLAALRIAGDGSGGDGPGVRRAAVLALSGDEIGEVVVTADPARIILALDGPADWPGTWTCEVRDLRGRWRRVGAWTADDVADGRDWSSPLPASGTEPVAMRVRGATGAVLALADLG